jgi:hypothetical protein
MEVLRIASFRHHGVQPPSDEEKSPLPAMVCQRVFSRPRASVFLVFVELIPPKNRVSREEIFQAHIASPVLQSRPLRLLNIAFRDEFINAFEPEKYYIH